CVNNVMVDINDSLSATSHSPHKKEVTMKRIIGTLTLVTLTILMAASIRAQTIYLPACGSDVSANALNTIHNKPVGILLFVARAHTSHARRWLHLRPHR